MVKRPGAVDFGSFQVYVDTGLARVVAEAWISLLSSERGRGEWWQQPERLGVLLHQKVQAGEALVAEAERLVGCDLSVPWPGGDPSDRIQACQQVVDLLKAYSVGLDERPCPASLRAWFERTRANLDLFLRLGLVDPHAEESRAEGNDE